MEKKSEETKTPLPQLPFAPKNEKLEIDTEDFVPIFSIEKNGKRRGNIPPINKFF